MKLFKSNFHHNARVEKMSFKLGIDEHVIEETLDIMYDYIRMKLDEVETDKTRVLTEEEFNDCFPVICIPSLGYIKPSYKKYKHIMKNKLKKQHAKNTSNQ